MKKSLLKVINRLVTVVFKKNKKKLKNQKTTSNEKLLSVSSKKYRVFFVEVRDNKIDIFSDKDIFKIN